MRNSKQYGGSITQSEAKTVDNVHTPISVPLKPSTYDRIPKTKGCAFPFSSQTWLPLQQTFAILKSATFPFVEPPPRRAAMAAAF